MDNPLKSIAPSLLGILLNPWCWLALIVWTGIVAAGAGSYAAGEARKQAELDEQKRTTAALQAQATENEQVMLRERALRNADHTEFNKYFEDAEHEKAAATRLVADLRNDVKRLRVPIIRPVREETADAGGPTAAATGQEGYAELTPDAGAFLVGLLARGDEGIRKHAAVVDRYERLRLACTASSTTSEPPNDH